MTGVCRDPTEQYPALMHVNLSARSHAGNQTINMPEVLYLEKQAQRCSATSQFNLLIMAYSPGDQVSWIPSPGPLSVDARLPSVPSTVAETFFCFVRLHLKRERPGGMGRIKDCFQSNTPQMPVRPQCRPSPLCSVVSLVG